MHEDRYPLISNERDPRFLKLSSLQTASGRSKTKSYLIEGIRHVARAAEQSGLIEQLFVEPSTLSNQFGRKIARRLRTSGVPAIRLTSQLYRNLTLAAEPQGIGAVVRQRWWCIEDLKAPPDSLWLALESVEQPGNLGTILRTAEAADVDGVFLLGEGSDPWDPVCVRASMGSLFPQRLVRCHSAGFVQWARSNRVVVIASSPSGLLDFKALRCRWPAALLIGSERHGLSPQSAEAAHFSVRIPMRGQCDSINASVATGVLLFEMASQRRRPVGASKRNQSTPSSISSHGCAQAPSGQFDGRAGRGASVGRRRP
jgi:RNA methyltransferase, TrmH family